MHSTSDWAKNLGNRCLVDDGLWGRTLLWFRPTATRLFEQRPPPIHATVPMWSRVHNVAFVAGAIKKLQHRHSRARTVHELSGAPG